VSSIAYRCPESIADLQFRDQIKGKQENSEKDLPICSVANLHPYYMPEASSLSPNIRPEQLWCGSSAIRVHQHPTYDDFQLPQSIITHLNNLVQLGMVFLLLQRAAGSRS
jgi:hypothetical protein